MKMTVWEPIQNSNALCMKYDPLGVKNKLNVGEILYVFSKWKTNYSF
jgi:hypothetical protein